MISERSKKWIEAGKLLATDPTVNITCPECGLNELSVKDNINENNPQEVERLIFCTSCGAKNFLRLKKS